ncbi:hypothetical protein D3C87_2047060 [compost metagenome]
MEQAIAQGDDRVGRPDADQPFGYEAQNIPSRKYCITGDENHNETADHEKEAYTGRTRSEYKFKFLPESGIFGHYIF